MKALFGTDGIRGEAGQFPLDPETVSKIGFSLATHLANGAEAPQIVIGRDTRESGESIERAIVDGASKAGAKCLSAGVITTPGVAYLTRALQAAAGVVISASHNPYQDNGIKIFAPTGEKIDDSVERLIESDVYANIELPAPSQTNRRPISPALEEILRQEYLNFLAFKIGNELSLAGLTIVVDCANGASSALAPALFTRLGAKVIAINCNPDGRNINRDCGSLHIESLQERVVQQRADLGVAFDGDADRSLFVDGEGNFVDGDATLWVLGTHLQSHDELLRLNASLGGEQSGHIILPELSLAGDGMITALCLLRALREARKTLAEMVVGFQKYPQILVNVRVREKVPFDQMPPVQAEVEAVEELLSQKGRLLLRYSGTEPLARVMIEGENQFKIEGYADKIAGAI